MLTADDGPSRAPGPIPPCVPVVQVRTQLKKLTEDGYGHLPVCMAKTQSSFSTDAAVRGAPSGHVVNVREVRACYACECNPHTRVDWSPGARHRGQIHHCACMYARCRSAWQPELSSWSWCAAIS